jgi:hypothetical protein
MAPGELLERQKVGSVCWEGNIDAWIAVVDNFWNDQNSHSLIYLSKSGIRLRSSPSRNTAFSFNYPANILQWNRPDTKFRITINNDDLLKALRTIKDNLQSPPGQGK